MNNTLGLYIHIPFCRSKCPYCDFFSCRASESDYDNYIKCLKNIMKYHSEIIDKEIDTVYFGGGTPSVLGADRIAGILEYTRECFSVSNKAEITMEANPASGKFFDFARIAEFGVNRISLGMQSSNQKELKALGRLHSAEDVENTIKLIRKAGINNISLDLMMGIPYQTVESLRDSIDFCVAQNVSHISSYILKIEKGTIFEKRYDSYDFPSDEEAADLYLFAVDYLSKNGFEQYEISSFCKKGFESRHNLKYWTLGEYLGIGPAAHSFIDGKRFYYDRSFENFEKNIIRSEGEGGTTEEYIMLGLRLKRGLDLTECKKILGEKGSENLLKTSEKFVKAGLMEQKNNHLNFTPKGFLVSNAVLAQII